MSEHRQAWRLVKAARADTAFDGEGAYRFGGRWNSRGVRTVYASSTLALALLEILVHLDPSGRVPELLAIPIQIPTSCIKQLANPVYPDAGGDFAETLGATRRMGDDWIRSARQSALRVPSAIIPVEDNFLLNPEHPDFSKLEIGPASPFSFDTRLLMT
ncbi:MAG: RES family NAD+ phosphorylase [Opitutales bacterium]